MGTNFYRKKILTIDERKEIHKKLDDIIDGRNFESYDSLVNDIEVLYRGVHIGKSSFGWQFCFDHNWGEYYKLSKESLLNWLKEPNTYIENEYGTRYTYDEFIKYVEDHNNNPNNKWTAKTYDEFEKSRNPNYKSFDMTSRKKDFSIKFGFYPDDDDVNIDGYRFSIYSDFT